MIFRICFQGDTLELLSHVMVHQVISTSSLLDDSSISKLINVQSLIRPPSFWTQPPKLQIIHKQSLQYISSSLPLPLLQHRTLVQDLSTLRPPLVADSHLSHHLTHHSPPFGFLLQSFFFLSSPLISSVNSKVITRIFFWCVKRREAGVSK